MELRTGGIALSSTLPMEVCPDLWVPFYATDPGQATVNKYSMEPLGRAIPYTKQATDACMSCGVL